MTPTLNAPPPVAEALEELIARLKPLVPATLHSLVLYGGLAKGKALTATSDVDVLLVLASGSVRDLQAVAPALAEARRKGRVSPMVAARGELEGAMRSFPMKFHDIAGAHKVLLGEDPFAGRKPPTDGLREDVRRGLASLSLKLKRLYVARQERHDLLLDGLCEALSSALVSFHGLLELQAPPAPEKREEILARTAALLAVDEKPLQAILAAKKGGPFPDRGRVDELYEALLAAVAKAASA